MHKLCSTGAYSAAVIVCSWVAEFTSHQNIGYLYFRLVQVRDGFRRYHKVDNTYNGHPRDRLFGYISARESDLKVINNKNWACGKPRFQYKSF